MKRSLKQFFMWSLRSDLGGFGVALKGSNLTDIFSTNNADRVQSLFATRVERLREELQYDPDKNIQSILAHLKFEALLSDSLNAHSQLTANQQYVVEVNKGIIAFYVLLNAVVTDALNEPDIEKLLRGRYMTLLNSMVSIYLYLIDDELDRDDFELNVDPQKKGFLSGLGLADGDMIAMPWHMAWDHQLEFLLLHELGHCIFDDSQQQINGSREYAADQFAISTSRRIWLNQGTFHTSFCEFFQLIIFLYLDLHEFLLHGVENMVAHLATCMGVQLDPRRFRHPPALQRFCRAIDALDEVSHMGRTLFRLAEILMNSVKISVLRCEVDLLQFDRFASKRFHSRLKIRRSEKAIANLKIFKKMPSLNDLKTMWSPQTWLLHVPEKERDESISLLLDDEYTPFYDALVHKFGQSDNFRALHEGLNGYRIM